MPSLANGVMFSKRSHLSGASTLEKLIDASGVPSENKTFCVGRHNLASKASCCGEKN